MLNCRVTEWNMVGHSPYEEHIGANLANVTLLCDPRLFLPVVYEAFSRG